MPTKRQSMCEQQGVLPCPSTMRNQRCLRCLCIFSAIHTATTFTVQRSNTVRLLTRKSESLSASFVATRSALRLQMTADEPEDVSSFTNGTSLLSLFEKDEYPSSTDTAISFNTDNPSLQKQRRAAFDSFLLSSQDVGARLVDDKSDISIDATSVNSLVFLATLEEKSQEVLPLLMVVPTGTRVDTRRASRAVLKSVNATRVTNVSLAPPDCVEDICGFPSGCIPPYGHARPLLTIVDKSLVDKATTTLLGGGGHSEYSCEILADHLLRLDHVQVADIVVKTTNKERKQRVESVTTNGIIRTKPFFPVEPPSKEEVEQAIDHKGPAPLSLGPTPVTVLGRIGGVRQMARLLAFYDLEPPTQPNHDAANNNDPYPWRSGTDGQDMAVQLIAGKTLCNKLGDADGARLMRKLKKGMMVIVEGHTNVKSRESLIKWVTKRSLDIVVSSFRIFHEKETIHGNIGTSWSASNGVDRTSADQGKFPLSTSAPPAAHPAPTIAAASFLKLTDVLESPQVLLVDDLESVTKLSETISEVLLSLTTFHRSDDKKKTIDPNNDSQTVHVKQVSVGLDCEWKPASLLASSSDPQTVTLLQLSVQSLGQVFLLDLQRLLRPLQPESEPMTELESALSDALLNLFQSTKLLKVGFQLVSDLRRLAASFPHVPAFRTVHAVVEISAVAVQRSMDSNKQRRSRQKRQSLAALTESLTGNTLNKEQQVSDWEQRPLTSEQIKYASLDAAVTPFLLERLFHVLEVSLTRDLANSASTYEVGRWKGDQSFSKFIISWRFVTIQTDDLNAIRKLKAKTVVGDDLFVSQNWATGRTPPRIPSPPSSTGDGKYTDKRGILRLPCHTVSMKQGEGDVRGEITALMGLIGKKMGKSKDRCLEALLQGTDSLPEGTQLDFYQRAGYVEFQDAVVLFVNMPNKQGQVRPTNYPNKWLDGGKGLTWFLREKEWKNGTSQLARKIACCSRAVNGNKDAFDMTALSSTDDSTSSTILFVRLGKDEFICCGRCRASLPKPCNGDQTLIARESWELVQLHLQLEDWERLSESEEFLDMVSFQWNE